MENHCHKAKACCLGFAVGIVWAIGVFGLAVGAMYLEDFGVPMVGVLGSIYSGYEVSWPGAFIGAGWALVDGFITGVLIGWLYNMGCCFCRICCKKSTGESKPGCCGG